MAASRLLVGSSLSDRVLVQHGGTPVLFHHAALRDALSARAPLAADLFAEPVLDRSDSGPPTRVSWYAPANQDPVTLDTLSPSTRALAETALRERFAALAPLFSDPGLGPLLRAALAIAGRDDILWTGEAPVLVNWGLVPVAVGTDTATLERHFQSTFRGLVDPGASPWANAPKPTPPRAAAPVAAAIAPTAAVTAVAAAPVAPTGWARPLGAAGAILGALAIVLLLSAVCLTAGFYYGWTRLVRQLEASAPPPRDPQFDADIQRIQQGVNDGLRRRIAELEQAGRGDVCLAVAGDLPDRPAEPGGQAPPNRTPMPHAALPPPPEQQPVQRPPPAPGQPAPPATNLADVLEDSVVMVLGEVTGPQGDGLRTGSGFAIGPDRIVTNNHVVEGVAPGKLFVASRKLGHVVGAEVVAHTPGSEPGQPDFAVIRIKDGALPPLTLSPTVDRLVPIVAVGFPGFVSEASDEFKRLMAGDMTAAPNAHFTTGEVSGIQAFHSQPVVIHTAAINHGNSGGPLADRCGRVVGINTFIRTDAEVAYNVDYALPAQTILTFLQQNGIPAATDAAACQPEAAFRPAAVPTPTPTPAPAPAPSPAPAPPTPAK